MTAVHQRGRSSSSQTGWGGAVNIEMLKQKNNNKTNKSEKTTLGLMQRKKKKINGTDFMTNQGSMPENKQVTGPVLEVWGAELPFFVFLKSPPWDSCWEFNLGIPSELRKQEKV